MPSSSFHCFIVFAPYKWFENLSLGKSAIFSLVFLHCEYDALVPMT